MNDSSGFVLEIHYSIPIKVFIYFNIYFKSESLYIAHTHTQADALDYELVFVGDVKSSE